MHSANQLEEVPRRLSRLLYLLEDDVGGEEILSLQNRLSSILGLSQAYMNPPVRSASTEAEGEEMTLYPTNMENDNFTAPVRV